MVREFRRKIFCLLAAGLLSGTVVAQSAVELYERQAAAPQAGECFTLPVDLAASPGFTDDTADGKRELRYRMAFNQIAEGWSWQPGSDPATQDYYRYKFLPLQTVIQERGEYHAEDKIGVDQAMQVVWRYDYFLAFENLYDFYPRSVDDDAGFALEVAAGRPLRPGIRVSACLKAPVVSESTTFWKAIHARPTDYTLKKRYLVADLAAVEFVDLATGDVLGVLKSGRHDDTRTSRATAREPVVPASPRDFLRSEAETRR